MEEERNAQTKVAVSTFKLVCVLLSMLGGGTATIFSTCACVNDWRWHSHNLHLEPWVCVLMSMPGGGIATISTLKVVCVCSCQCLVVEEWEDLLSYKRKA